MSKIVPGSPEIRLHTSKLITEIERHIVGQTSLVERLLVALIAGGHVLLEGMPGLAKTKTLSVLTRAITCHMGRIQFTPDLLPSDLIGTEVYRPAQGDFVVRKGPLFANLVLADEINRAPAKVQSALLQAMQEHAVTIGPTTFPLPDPFLVLATQNPIEQAGTYPLPEAQLDRFLFKIRVTYPTFDEELAMLHLVTRSGESSDVHPVIDISAIQALKKAAFSVHVDQKIERYIVSLVQATRNTRYGLAGSVEWGASPRASISLKIAARALALIRGREFVSPDDVKELAADVLRHRIVIAYEAESRGVTSDDVVKALLREVSIT